MSDFCITSDWHFGDEQVYVRERGGKFATIASHDLFIAQSVAVKLSEMDENDTFYFLGDFGTPHDKVWGILERAFSSASCKTVCLLGNHDRSSRTKEQLGVLFDEVHENPIFISKRCVLSHYPYIQQRNVLNVSGHLHSSTLDLPNHLCVSFAVAGYKFVSKREVDNAISNLPKWDMRFLYEPWAEHYVFWKSSKDIIKDKDGKIDLSASRVYRRIQEEKKNSQGKFE